MKTQTQTQTQTQITLGDVAEHLGQPDQMAWVAAYNQQMVLELQSALDTAERAYGEALILMDQHGRHNLEIALVVAETKTARDRARENLARMVAAISSHH